jgi:hypothetical protein
VEKIDTENSKEEKQELKVLNSRRDLKVPRYSANSRHNNSSTSCHGHGKFN